MKKKLLIPGVLLLLCLPLFIFAGGITSYYLPRQYYSRARIEFKGEESKLTEAFQAATSSFRKQVTLQSIRNIGLYDIGVFAPDRQEAADQANSIALALQKTLQVKESRDPMDRSFPLNQKDNSFRIWEKAEVSLAPAKPSVTTIMLITAAVGLFFALIGGVLVIAALVSRDSRSVSA